MNTRVKEGNYEKIGVSQQQEWVSFTFRGEKEDNCVVVLADMDGKVVKKIPVPEEFCMGSLRSIAVKNLEVEKFVYYFEINGKRQMDPYAHAIVGRQVWNDQSRWKNGYVIYDAFASEKFDWGRDTHPEIPRSEMIMYKLHVRGFTMDSGFGQAPGTFYALTRRISYLKKLGITTVELMPVYEFEELEFPEDRKIPESVEWKEAENDKIKPGKKTTKALDRINYWGYKEGEYFSVKSSYARNPLKATEEYKMLVKKLHENGMECIMEMFFPETVNHNLILEVLRYWVMEYHVDGFHLLGVNLPVTAIVQDCMLSRTKIFYTHFDNGYSGRKSTYKNLYVYNDEYMYPARRVLNHLDGNMHDFADQQRKQGTDIGYVNYIAGNNGFTLADVFMYNEKHNEVNGEDNMDGSAWNFSCNYGVEGPSRKKYINQIRKLKWRNSIVMLMMAQAVPLIWSGDEMCNSQQGNNNAYCQDNQVGWLNWKNERSHQKELDFIKKMIRFRKAHPIVANEIPFCFSDYRFIGTPDLSYHGECAWMFEPSEGRLCLGIMYCGAYSKEKAKEENVYVAYNFQSAMSYLALPKPPKGTRWHLVMDSGNVAEPFLKKEEICPHGKITIAPQTIRIYVSKKVAKKDDKTVEGK